MSELNRREALKLALAALAAPRVLGACMPTTSIAADDADAARLRAWNGALCGEGLTPPAVSAGRAATRVGELAVGTPYEAFTLEAYIRAGGNPRGLEPLALSLTKFDCVTLVESCLAIARVAAAKKTAATWPDFAREVERMRYRGGERGSYTSRLHYFSEWISDGQSRGLLRDLGADLGGAPDTRPLRFMTEHRASYPALADDAVFAEIGAMERGLDGKARHVVPADRIDDVAARIESGDVLAFATSIAGLDVSHAAFAYRDTRGVLRVLHAPLSGGSVEVTRSTLPEYVRGIRRSTGILIARPLYG